MGACDSLEVFFRVVVVVAVLVLVLVRVLVLVLVVFGVLAGVLSLFLCYPFLRHPHCETIYRRTCAGSYIDAHAQADSYAVLFFFRSDLGAFQPIADVLPPPIHGVGRALLGMSSPTLREVPSSKIRFSTGAVRITAD